MSSGAKVKRAVGTVAGSTLGGEQFAAQAPSPTRPDLETVDLVARCELLEEKLALTERRNRGLSGYNKALQVDNERLEGEVLNAQLRASLDRTNYNTLLQTYDARIASLVTRVEVLEARVGGGSIEGGGESAPYEASDPSVLKSASAGHGRQSASSDLDSQSRRSPEDEESLNDALEQARAFA